MYALTGIPAAFLLFDDTPLEAKFKKAAVALAVPRVALFWLAIFLPSLSARALAGTIGGAIYGVEYIFSIVRRKKAPTYAPITRRQVALYYGAHLSAVNFALDMCSNGIKTMRIQHVFALVANAACVAILYVGLTIVDAYQRAWHCYPPHLRSLKDLSRGMCPMWEDYYGPVAYHSDSNRGVNNLVCRDFAKTDACITREIKAALPVFWHIAGFIATISFALSISLVRAKLREITIAEMEAASKK